jgi:hypothetical protein
MLPFKKWKKEILDINNCYNDFKNITTKEQAKKICAWNGWHWIVKIQLEMFFELKPEHVIEA